MYNIYGGVMLKFSEQQIREAIKCGNKAEAARNLNTTVTTINNYIEKYKIKYVHSPKYDDISNKKFNRWTVIKRAEGYSSIGGTKWLCKCDCGKEKIITRRTLLINSSKSCGCYKSEKVRINHYKDISAQFWRRFKNNASSRGISFDITKEYVWELYEKQGKRCKLSGMEIYFSPDFNKPQKQTASIDRIDSSKGYEIGNIQIVHKSINDMKTSLPQETFIAFCNLVSIKHEVNYETAKEIAVKSTLRKMGYTSKKQSEFCSKQNSCS